MDPRIKFICLILLNISLFMVTDILAEGILLLLLLIAGSLSRTISYIFRILRGWGIVMLFAFLLNTYYRGLIYGFFIILRFFSIIFSAVLFFATTKQSDILRCLLFFKIPRNYVIALSIGLRFIPVLSEDAKIMQEALLAKKIKFRGINKLRYAIDFLAALIGRTMQRVEYVAESLEMRGYYIKPYSGKISIMDILVLVGTISIVVWVILLEFFYEGLTFYLEFL